jgi:nitroimidazol reductase NimA-like FMN-containing flavoprotein (pyridoxamine 5'-phosphate oxidase superfamily)
MPEVPEGTSSRSTIKRQPDRARYDAATVHAILDNGLVAHVGFVIDGAPFVIPMVYARLGDTIFVHGARASRLQKQLADGVPVCVTVTLVDGLVLARSAYHHSMNYRSVVVFGIAREVTVEADKRVAFERLIDHIVPGRNERIRAADAAELRGTSVLAISIDEASAKTRTGPPIEEERDLPYPAWAGVVPFEVEAKPLIDAVGLDATQRPTESETNFRRP